MGRRERAKGQRRERQLAELLRDHGFESRRGRQFQGGAGSPDVVSTFPAYLECKGVEKSSPLAWLRQARGDSEGSPAVVAWKKSREPWIAILTLEDLFRLIGTSTDAAATDAHTIKKGKT